MRHASVDERYAGCYNGHIDIPLSRYGKEQAAKAADAIRNISFDAVYCSDLTRCVDSAKPLGLENIVYDERLREKSWGRAEGMKYDDICAEFGIKYENFGQFIDAVGGESLDEFSRRINSFFDELRRRPFKNTLVITHGGVIKTLLMTEKELTLEEAFGIDIPYAGITIIEDFG